VREADNLTAFICLMSWKSGSLKLLEPSGPHRACYGTPLPFYKGIDSIKMKADYIVCVRYELRPNLDMTDRDRCYFCS
jgi:hypothetical protein